MTGKVGRTRGSAFQMRSPAELGAELESLADCVSRKCSPTSGERGTRQVPESARAVSC